MIDRSGKTDVKFFDKLLIEKKMKGQDIKNAGLKVTLPRLQVLEFFEKRPGEHFSADDLFTQIRSSSSDIGLATIYRVLNQFEAAGLLIKHQ
ncbi:MAG: transcriptional repressor, partial [Robiginitomaculum sp.]|nr:transcriptional repressor [Robiginitomaculum sp.]